MLVLLTGCDFSDTSTCGDVTERRLVVVRTSFGPPPGATPEILADVALPTRGSRSPYELVGVSSDSQTFYFSHFSRETRLFALPVGSDSLRLIFAKEGWFKFDLSPLSDHFAYGSLSSGSNLLGLVDVDGSNDRTLRVGYARLKQWLADGQHIIYETGGIWMLNINTGARTQLINEPPIAYDITPDGSTLVYYKPTGVDSTFDTTIYFKTVADTSLTAIEEGGYPALSVDGQRIAFLKPSGPNRPVNYSLWVLDRATSERRQLLGEDVIRDPGSEGLQSLRFTLDGDYLLYGKYIVSVADESPQRSLFGIGGTDIGGFDSGGAGGVRTRSTESLWQRLPDGAWQYQAVDRADYYSCV